MRGKVLIAFAVSHSDRITPAYAGKSKGLYLHVDVTRDHPRLCGEKQYFLSLVRKYMGSPPPMRGKVRQISDLLFQIRITPAYAGKRNPYSRNNNTG